MFDKNLVWSIFMQIDEALEKIASLASHNNYENYKRESVNR
jgi:hypothetical protein